MSKFMFASVQIVNILVPEGSNVPNVGFAKISQFLERTGQSDDVLIEHQIRGNRLARHAASIRE